MLRFKTYDFYFYSCILFFTILCHQLLRKLILVTDYKLSHNKLHVQNFTFTLKKNNQNLINKIESFTKIHHLNLHFQQLLFFYRFRVFLTSSNVYPSLTCLLFYHNHRGILSFCGIFIVILNQCFRIFLRFD